MNLLSLSQDIIVYNILIPFIINSAPIYKDALQPIINLNAISKYFKVLVENPQYKNDLYSALINQLEDKDISDILCNIKNAEQAQQTLLTIAKSPELFLNQYGKRSSQDFIYMNKLVIVLLKQKGACINSGTTPDNSPLSISLKYHDKSYFAEALLAHGAFPFHKDQHGTTLLMTARIYGKSNIYDILLKYGVDPDAKDNYGHTVYSDKYADVKE